MSSNRFYPTAIFLIILVSLVIVGCTQAKEEPRVSTSDVFFSWDGDPVGSSELRRADGECQAGGAVVLRSSGL